MCGICGVLNIDGQEPLPDLAPALDALRHRGPDAFGIRDDGVCRLGHRRLSIIDLSDAGRQPISNETGTVWLTFNGHIYNFHALRRELEGCGHRFSSHTDSEVVVQAYEQWGPEAVRRFRGMLAFGLWDQARRRLVLAKDRLGKKPLFYASNGGRLYFASEMQGVLAHADVPRAVYPAAIDHYLSLGYVPAPLTAFRAVRKLPPAHVLTVDLADAGPRTDVQRYWTLRYEPKSRLDPQQGEEALREKLTEAVRIRMLSDVPLGAFLSGGIDSSIVVGLMAGLSSAPVRTFSIGFRDAQFDERDAARRVADRWGTEHHELVVEPDAAAVLPGLVRHFGGPFADSSADLRGQF